jgi:hypothetical protein
LDFFFEGKLNNTPKAVPYKTDMYGLDVIAQVPEAQPI